MGCRRNDDVKFIYTALQEKFFVEIKIAFFGAMFIAFPVIATQLYKFVAPGLYKNERGAFLPFLIATPILFVIRSLSGLFSDHAAGHPVLPVT